MTADHHHRQAARPPTTGEEEASTGRATGRCCLAALDWDLDTMPLDDRVDDLGDALRSLSDDDLQPLDDETVVMLDHLGLAPIDDLLRPAERRESKRVESDHNDLRRVRINE